MPNGYHPQEPPQEQSQTRVRREPRVGICPGCRSARIRTRQRRHWRLIWRCQRCNRVFARPSRVHLSQARDVGRSPVYESRIARLESRARRKLGGRNGLSLGWPIWLAVGMVCSGVVVFWLVSNGKMSIVTPPSVTRSIPQLLPASERATTRPNLPTAANGGALRSPATSRPTIPISLPSQRHLEEKLYILELINGRRARAGVPPLELGSNNAAQLHAESSLQDCTSSHWGTDGLKPYMRYSLAGGYQSNGENGSGSDYCIKWSDGYRSLDPTEVEIREAMEQWMRSPGHRSNILDRWYKKVNVGLAWDRYNFKAFQHFEGDYIEFDSLPAIEDGILTLTGRARNGARFADEGDLMVQVYYDPPPHPLTRGQVARTYCYDLGLPVAGLREPATGGWYYSEQAFSTTHQPCPDPYDVDPEASAPESAYEADRFWQQAYAASHSTVETITVPWITALVWTADGDRFSVTADLRKVIGQHGDGVYTVLLWDRMNGEDAVISQYSMFHGVTAPETYSGDGN